MSNIEKVCAICRCSYLDLCISCEAENEDGFPINCQIAHGKCEHKFHKHCIDLWLASRNGCPLDAQTWETDFLEDGEAEKKRKEEMRKKIVKARFEALLTIHRITQFGKAPAAQVLDQVWNSKVIVERMYLPKF